MSLSQLPNLICILRIALAVPVVWLLVEGEFALTLWLFVAAAASDALDGFLAKTFDWRSELGKVLDPLADKLLLVSVFITLAVLGLVPAWLAVVAVLRDVVIGAGAWIYLQVFGPLEGRPTPVSKLNTLLQILYVVAVVAQAAFPAVPVALLTALGAGVLLTTVISGVDYVMTYIRKAVAVSRARRAAA